MVTVDDKIRGIARHAILDILWEAEKGIDRKTMIFRGKEMIELIVKWQPKIEEALKKVYNDAKRNPYRTTLS